MQSSFHMIYWLFSNNLWDVLRYGFSFHLILLVSLVMFFVGLSNQWCLLEIQHGVQHVDDLMLVFYAHNSYISYEYQSLLFFLTILYENVDNYLFSFFYLSIALWIVCLWEPFLNFETFAKLPDLFYSKIIFIIHDGRRGNIKSIYDVFSHGFHNLRPFRGSQRYSFYPFYEIFYSY